MPVSLERGCALPDAEVTLPVLLSTLKGDLRGKSLFARSLWMARCLAFMPDLRWRACLWFRATWLASPLARLGHLLTLEHCFWGWGVRQRELPVKGAMTFTELPEKPGGISA